MTLWPEEASVCPQSAKHEYSNDCIEMPRGVLVSSECEKQPEEPSGYSEAQKHHTGDSDEWVRIEEKPQTASVSPEKVETEKALAESKQKETVDFPEVQDDPKEYSNAPQYDKQQQEIFSNSGCEGEPQAASGSPEFEQPEEASGSSELQVEVLVTSEREEEPQAFLD